MVSETELAELGADVGVGDPEVKEEVSVEEEEEEDTAPCRFGEGIAGAGWCEGRPWTAKASSLRSGILVVFPVRSLPVDDLSEETPDFIEETSPRQAWPLTLRLLRT